jgi:hypothetical protein
VDISAPVMQLSRIDLMSSSVAPKPCLVSPLSEAKKKSLPAMSRQNICSKDRGFGSCWPSQFPTC